jgi:hypothetical protein
MRTFRPALEASQPSVQWVPGAISFEVKQLEREPNHSPPSSVEDNNTSTSACVFMAQCLINPLKTKFLLNSI